ncbi:hypothetical protein A3Q56_00555 [Intoshia linei]|uniref:Tc3 transposase DNA binding domain-containing protein n=1 Tax=Intoshia linei TaxID=1819745 RepID=A0A177BBT2_9BILA|nr:hypothetical protein A3Q56_00555 [Intoshia linei]
MGKGKKLNNFEKGQILALYNEGKSYIKIGIIIGRSKDVVRNYCIDSEGYGKKKSSGRPKCISPRDERRLLGLVTREKCTATQIFIKMNNVISIRSIQRTLQHFDLFLFSRIKTIPRLLKKYKKSRMISLKLIY